LTQTATKTRPELTPQQVQGDFLSPQASLKDSLFAHLSFLWDRRRLLQKAALVGLLLGLVLALSIPKRYESTTQLMPPDSQSTSGLAMLATLSTKASASAGGLAPLAGDLLGMKSSGALFVGVLRSSTVAERLVDRFNLCKVYGTRYPQDAGKILERNTAIGEDRKSGIIAITVTDRDPARAAAIANDYVETLNQLVSELSTSSAHRERVFLEERLVGVKHDLDQASRDFSQFASKNKTLDIKEEARAMLQGAATIEGQLIAAESELKGLQAIYTDNNVRVRAVQGRIAELRQQMEKLGGSASDKAAPGSNDSTHPSLSTLPLLGVTYADLYRRVQIQEAVYEALTQQYELAKVEEAKETPSVKQLDRANFPEHKSFPPRTLIVLCSALLGVFVTSAWLVGQQRWRAIAPDDSGKLFAQQVFQSMNASMPWAPPNGSFVQAWTNRVWTKFVSKKQSPGEFRDEKDSSQN
jgi:capsule polysaccharide export protein KpsE/RkpR